MNDPRVTAMFKRPRHNILAIFISSQAYFELRKGSTQSNGGIYRIFKPNNIRDIQNLYQHKTSMDMTLNEFKCSTSSCWDKKYQPFTIDMTKDKNKDSFRLSLNSIFIPDSSLF